MVKEPRASTAARLHSCGSGARLGLLDSPSGLEVSTLFFLRSRYSPHPG